MPSAEKPRFTIIGAGLTGALLANYLARAGFEVNVYEARPDPREFGFVGGRSINLAISARGFSGLSGVGLEQPIRDAMIPMRGRMIHAPTGKLSFQPYDKDPTRCINSISRGGLNLALIAAAAEHPNVRFHFGFKCLDVHLEHAAARLLNTETGQETTTAGEILVGADGAFSAVRGAMQRLDRFNYRQDYLEHGYKELTIPPDAAGGFRMEKNALHIWPRRAFMMIALPNPDGSFTCTCFWPLAGRNSFAAVQTEQQIRRFFERQFPDAVPLMPTLVEDFQKNPTGSLMTVRCHPWHCRDRVVLIGDAAHAIVPFYGQGMNAGFEDCVELDRCLREFAPDYGRALAAYTARRKENADTIAALALTNFIEMRDRAATGRFRARKALERTLHRFWPGYTPLYTMVSFTTAPYAEAARRARAQDRIVSAALLVLLLALAAAVLGVLLR